jgi:hypothetical protein
MSKQVLAIFKADTGRPQPAAKRVLQVMNPDIGQSSLNTRRLPSRGQHLFYGLAIVAKHMSCMPTSARLNNRAGHPIEHDEARLGVLDDLTGDNENRRAQFRHRDIATLDRFSVYHEPAKAVVRFC